MTTTQATRQIKSSRVLGFENPILVACHLNSSYQSALGQQPNENHLEMCLGQFKVSTCHANVEQVRCTCDRACCCIPGAPKSKTHLQRASAQCRYCYVQVTWRRYCYPCLSTLFTGLSPTYLSAYLMGRATNMRRSTFFATLRAVYKTQTPTFFTGPTQNPPPPPLDVPSPTPAF
ncbi:hypothetical protein EDD16DRAFT_941560 [Pisolithus croceorrhizus]|nr:hypothetical protein EDD16DRAFT_941560 [Pisolithus croceorrhizus]